MEASLETVIRLVAEVNSLSSPSATKFNAVRDALADLCSLEVARVEVKYLADPKNYGNRLSEALRQQPDLLLVLLRDQPGDLLFSMIHRRLELSPATAVLVLGRDTGSPEGWEPVGLVAMRGARVAAEVSPRLEGVRLTEFETVQRAEPTVSDEKSELLEDELAQVCQGRNLRDLARETDKTVDRLAAASGIAPDKIRVVVNADPKNLENRMGEAVAIFPDLLVVLTSSDLALRARSVSERLDGSRTRVIVGIVDDPSDLGSEGATDEPRVVAETDASSMRSRGADETERASSSPKSAKERGRMRFKEVKLVEELVAHLPMDAHSQFLYEEHTKGQEDREPYRTRAFEYVVDLVADKNVSLIVLTGDAGHGKTHLCRRVLVHGGVDNDEALDVLKRDLKGTQAVHLKESERAVRVVKDLSEIRDLGEAASLLAEILDDTETVGIVSANEGRLREVVGCAPEELGTILSALDEGVHNGSTSHDGIVHVVNLNYQAITPAEDGFLLHQLDQWVKDGRRWRSCSTCAAHEHCPIAESREYLGARDDSGDSRREGLVHLVRAAEQTGYVLTIRETLILLAYLITGGVTCRKVHEAVKSRQLKFLEELKLQELLFVTKLDLTDEQLGVLNRIRRFDPGFVPHRDIDEGIIEDLEGDDSPGNGAGLGEGPVSMTSGQLRREANSLQALVRSRRRLSFFEAPGTGLAGMMERSRRLGLYHYARFNHIQTDDEDPEKMQPVVRRVVDGLHVIQGIRPTSRSGLYLVDPAFSRSGSTTSVIAVRIPINELWLLGLHEYWQQQQGGKVPSLMRSVDWLNREVVLCRQKADATDELVTFDLLQFEFVMRAAEGVVFPAFHSADRRRILMRLARLAEAGSAQEEEIRFIEGDALKKIVIQRSGKIEVHRGD